MKLSREWATPLTIGVFGLMASTGLLMFFHADNNLQKELHEWAGWIMVLAVVAHAGANWLGFRRYFQSKTKFFIIALFGVILLGSFAANFGSKKSQNVSPPAIAIAAVTKAPLYQIAPLFNKTAEDAKTDLKSAGFNVSSDAQSIEQLAGNDREKVGKALSALAAH